MTTTSDSYRSQDKSVRRLAQLFFLLLPSIFITAIGQPDRGSLFSLLSYCVGYLSIFFILLQFRLLIVRFIIGFFWMMFVQLSQLNWLATTTYHGTGILIVYALIVLGIAAQFGLLTFFLPKDKPLTFVRSLAIASIWTIIEISRLYYLCGFPFNPTGLVMTFHPMMMQMAAIFGVYGLSFWVILTSAWGAASFHQSSPKYLVIWLFLLLLPPLFGYGHMYYHDQRSRNAKIIETALVQTGLEVEQKWEFPKKAERFIPHFEQWKQIFQLLDSTEKKNYDLIILPEVALPGDAFQSQIEYERCVNEIFRSDDRLPLLEFPVAETDNLNKWQVSHIWMAQALANRFKSELVIGLIDFDTALDESYNSAFHIVPFRTAVHRYEKRVLVPLAEYLPLPMMKSFLEEYGITSFFTPGKKAKVFTGQIPLSVSICYEEGFNNLMREARALGAKLLVNVTNDGWFPKSRLPQEHFNLGRVRSIENGVPVLRACNTGITAAIDSLGRVKKELKETDAKGNNTRGVVATSLNTYSYTTVFSLLGNSLILLISSIILLTFFFYKRALQF